MSGVLNDCDALLQGATVRIVNPKNADIILMPTAPAFHLDAAGTADIASITVNATLVGLEGGLAFSAQGATLTGVTGKSATITLANMQGLTAILTASMVSGGVTFSRSCIIATLQDGADGGAGARGAGMYFATGNAWSDGTADAATPGGNVVGDVVSISNGSTYAMWKKWNGTAWSPMGAVFDGSLFVTGSIHGSALKAGTVEIRKPDGTLLLGAGGEFGAIVRASNLAVGPTGALNRDPNMEDFANCWTTSGSITLAGAGGSAPAKQYAGAFSGAVGIITTTEFIPIDITKTYNLQVSVYADGGNTRSCYLLIQFYDGAGTKVVSSWGNASYSGYINNFVPNVGDWRPFNDNQFGAKTNKLVPANAKTCKIVVALNDPGAGGGSSATLMGVTAVRLVEALGTTSIGPGAITTKNLAIADGGDISSGQTAFNQGVGFWLEGAGNGHGARMSLGNSGGPRMVVDPNSNVFEFIGPTITAPVYAAFSVYAGGPISGGTSAKTWTTTRTATITGQANFQSIQWSIADFSDSGTISISSGASSLTVTIRSVTGTFGVLNSALLTATIVGLDGRTHQHSINVDVNHY